MITKAISFWQFLSKYSIEIPIIQRDYAQGRLGREKLRRSFLENIKQALDGEKTIKLDFVYGSESQGVLYPLDGQQRLTTLWLLHWYVALLAGKLTDASEVLSKFTYETRVSSREFCGQLCCANNFTAFNGGKIVEYIKEQTWFYAEWSQDPTIQAMLRMLGGTDEKDKNGNDVADGLEELLGETKIASEYWDCLTGKDSPIVFYHLPLRDFGLTDDLYIKMNARGKQLTPFENFKADLIGHVKSLSENDDVMRKLESSFSYKMDNDWTNFFWEKKSIGFKKDGKLQADNRIDEIYFAFINRYLWGERVALVEKEDKSFNYLNEDRYEIYNDFSPYKFVDGKALEGLYMILNNLISYKYPLPICNWEKEFKFIPEYKEEDGYNKEKISGILEVDTLNQIERIAFVALCKYFREGEGDVESLTRWMRVVWNLISGKGPDDKPQIRDLETVGRVIRFINQLDSRNVYENLIKLELPEPEKRSEFDKRCQEEKDKAEQILNDETGLWETKIRNAEEMAFFNGSIRFLYRDGKNNIDWDAFDDKVKWAKEQFVDKKRDLDMLRRLFSKFSTEDIKETYWAHKTFKNNDGTWLFYLLNEQFADPVNKFITDDPQTQICVEKGTSLEENIRYYLSMTNLLDVVGQKIPDAWIRNPHSCDALYYRSEGVFFNNYSRDALLFNTPNVEIINAEPIICNVDKKPCLLYGFDVDFTYEGFRYTWYRNGCVYLKEGPGNNIYAIKDSRKKEDLDKYFCFNGKDLDQESFVQSLRNLVTEYNNLKS